MMANLDEQILKELQMLRKLKMMELTKAGYAQTEIGDALGISSRSVRRLLTNPKKSNDDGK